MANFIRLIEMFDLASTNIKYPKITLNSDVVIVLYRTGERSKYPGSISVVNDCKDWYGSISRNGAWHPSQSCPSWLENYLHDLAINPEQIAALHGRKTGSCCFCNRKLTDNRSVELGYGPICAERYGLKWGSDKPIKPTKKAYKMFQKDNPLNLNFEAWASIQIMGF